MSRAEPTGPLRFEEPSGAPGPRRYHHGDLRRVLLDTAAQVIEREGAAGLSLRALARAADVSHAAPTHHFGDKPGLLTALAAEGHRLLAADMRAAMAAGDGSFLEAAVAYVRFAVTHPAHFAVMFRPDLLHRDDPELRAAGAESRAVLQEGAGRMSSRRGKTATASGEEVDAAEDQAPTPAAVAAWSLVHGLATLQLTGNLPPGSSVADLENLTRAAAAQLFRGP